MSLWGEPNNFIGFEMIILPVISKHNLNFPTTSKFNNDNFIYEFKDKDKNKLLEILIGFLDGDGYFDIGVQKQYNKNLSIEGKSTIRIRLGINLQYKDKEILEFIVKNLGVGKIDYSESKKQYRLIFYKKDILNVIHPYMQSKNIEFLVNSRRKQYFLYKYIMENNIKHSSTHCRMKSSSRYLAQGWISIGKIRNHVLADPRNSLGFLD